MFLDKNPPHTCVRREASRETKSLLIPPNYLHLPPPVSPVVLEFLVYYSQGPVLSEDGALSNHKVCGSGLKMPTIWISEMAQCLKTLVYKQKDQTLGPPNPYKFQMCMAACL